MKSKTSSKGFTLLELLVTIGIVGILASVAVSMFQEYRARAYNMKALLAVYDMRVAAELLRDDLIEPMAALGLGVVGLYSVEHTPGTTTATETLIGISSAPNTDITEILSAHFRDPELYLKIAVAKTAEVVHTWATAHHCKGSDITTTSGNYSSTYKRAYWFNLGSTKYVIVETLVSPSSGCP